MFLVYAEYGWWWECGARIIFYVYMIIHTYMQQGTTVRISLGTKAVLDDLKIHKKESYDEVIGRLSHLAYDDEPMTDEELQGSDLTRFVFGDNLGVVGDDFFYGRNEVSGITFLDKAMFLG